MTLPLATAELLEAALTDVPGVGVILFDREMRILSVHGASPARHGYLAERIVGRRLPDVVPARAWERLGAFYARALTGETVTTELDAQDGTAAYESTFSPIREGGAVVGGAVISRDITAQRRARREAAEQFERAFADAPIGMALVGLDGSWLRVNRALADMLAYSEAELMARTFQDITHPDDLGADLAQVQRLLAGEIRTYSMEKRYVTAHGHLIWVLLSVSVVRDERGEPRHFVSQIMDISERKRLEEHLHHLADHDPLTGTWNRRRFEDELARQVARCQRYGERAALVCFDLDGFKYVNDTFGHKAGDGLIVHVARTVQARLRETDSFARLGGDEFAVLLANISPAAAERTAHELCELVADTPLSVGGEPVHTTISAGVAIVDRHATTEEDAFVAADVALYEAKHGGRNRAVSYDPSGRQRERLTTGLVWSQRLRRALDGDGFVLHAQPVVDLETGRTTFYELLVRMRGPDGELIGPATFLYCAERFGYIRRLDQWVVEEAARLAAAHPDATFSVNLSAKSVTDPAIGEHIEDAIAAAGCCAEQLIFEITETAAIANMEQARSLARRLARLGSRLGLDDFGSGFASFYHLKTLPLDILKIDGEFIRNLGRDRDDQLVVRAVQDVARGMGKIVVAEHVEDEAAAQRLRELGVPQGQGYHFARPGPVDDVLRAAPAGVRHL